MLIGELINYERVYYDVERMDVDSAVGIIKNDIFERRTIKSVRLLYCGRHRILEDAAYENM